MIRYKQFTLLRLPLVRKDRRFFICRKEDKSQMKRYFRDHWFNNMLPFGETKSKEPISDETIFVMDQKKAA